MIRRSHTYAKMLAATAMLAAGVSTTRALANSGQPEPFIQLPEPAKPVDPIERYSDPAEIGPAFDRLVGDLGSEKFTVRQRATEQLEGNEQFTLEMMEAALASGKLSLEARYRMSSIARQRFYRTPRAALGFRFGEQLRDPVVVGEVFAPFPAAKILEPGDLIIRADGVKLEGPAAKPLLQAIIISHDPGEILHLTIRRGAKKMDLDVPLGKFEDLGNGGGPLIEERMTRAWRFRVQSRMGGVGEPVRIAGTEGSWITSMEEAQRRLDIAMRRDMNELPLRFAGGGMPRAAQGGEDGKLFEQVSRPQVVVINGQARVMNMPMFRPGVGMFGQEFDPDAGLLPVRAEEQLARLLELKQAYERQLGNVDPETMPVEDPRRPDKLEIKKKLLVVSRQYEAIEAERDEARAANKPKPDASGKLDANAPPAP